MKSGDMPKAIYRYFDYKEHAMQLLDGFIRLSTFDYVRNMDHKRCDPYEAKLMYEPWRAYWDDEGKPNDAALTLTKLGFARVDPGARRIEVIGGNFALAYPNSYLFCASLERSSPRMQRMFGEYRVRIVQPDLFFLVLTEALLRSGYVFSECDLGLVRYSMRNIMPGATDIPHPVLIGPDSNSYEREFRMYWKPAQEHQIKPLTLEVPEIRTYCSMV